MFCACDAKKISVLGNESEKKDTNLEGDDDAEGADAARDAVLGDVADDGVEDLVAEGLEDEGAVAHVVRRAAVVVVHKAVARLDDLRDRQHVALVAKALALHLAEESLAQSLRNRLVEELRLQSDRPLQNRLFYPPQLSRAEEMRVCSQTTKNIFQKMRGSQSLSLFFFLLMKDGMTDEGETGLPDPVTTRPERAKTGRAKPPPRAKLTMEMLVAPNSGVDALLASLRRVRFSTTSLPFLSFLPCERSLSHCC